MTKNLSFITCDLVVTIFDFSDTAIRVGWNAALLAYQGDCTNLPARLAWLVITTYRTNYQNPWSCFLNKTRFKSEKRWHIKEQDALVLNDFDRA